MHEASPAPTTFSVVVNTCDRRDSLRTLLYGLEHQTWPHFEVIVVIGPTRDDSREMIAREFGQRVVVVDCPEFNLSVSRNLGVARAAGEVVAFVDDDAVPAPRWLEQLAEIYAADPDAAGAGGRTYDARPEVGHLQFLFGQFSVLGEQEDVRPDPSVELPWSTPPRFRFPRFHGTNMSYRRCALVELGGFDQRYEYLFDDADIGVRLGRAGRRLVQASRATVYHVPGSGRNRGKSPYDLNWYSWLRSTLYFTLKNGAPTVGRRRSLTSALRHVSTMGQRVTDLAAAGALPDGLHDKARGMIRKAVFHGFAQGLLGRRRLPAPIGPPPAAWAPFSPARRRLPAVSPLGFPPEGEWTPVTEAPLSIALLSVEYPPRSTHGVARSTHTLARGLAQLGHEVHVITRGEGHRVRVEDGVFVREVNGFGLGRYERFAVAGYPNLTHWLAHSQAVHEEIVALAADHRLQIVDTPLWHLDGFVTAVQGDLPVVVRAVTAMKQIADVHASPSPEAELLGELEGDLLGRAAGVVSNTRATAETLARVYGYRPDGHNHHSVVYYGLEPAPDSAVPPHEEHPGGDVSVLFVGRLEGRKGILDLFEAIPRVLAKAPRARFVIAGEDNSRHDGFLAREGMDYPAYFKKRYGTAASRVEFLGFVSDDRLDQLYRDCDLFVAPSLYESFGLIYLEAMNYARPTVGCRAGGPQEIIVEGETGFLVPPEDPKRLAEALSKLVGDPALRRAMGRAGRARLLEKFTHRAMAQGFVEHYRRLVRT